MNFVHLSKIIREKSFQEKKAPPATTESRIKFVSRKILTDFFPKQGIYVEKFDRGKVFILVNSSSLNQKIFWYKIDILEKINRLLGEEVVTDIRAKIR